MKYENPFKPILDNPKFAEWLSKNFPKVQKETLSNDESASDFLSMIISQGVVQTLLALYYREFPHAINKTLVNLIAIEDGVFRTYNPTILTFPMKTIIIENNKNILLRKIEEFTRHKLSCDCVVVGNRAYIEYFTIEQRNEAKLVPKESREVYRYKVSRKII